MCLCSIQLNAEGYFDATQLDALIIKEFPPYLHEKANASFMPCSEKGGKEIDTEKTLNFHSYLIALI